MVALADLPLRRFLHWGPITAMSIIGCITVTTVYMNEMWWPVTTVAAAFNKHCFIALSLATFVNFAYATLAGPGFLPLGWQPEPKERPAANGKLQECVTCDGFKAPRSHHCRKCGRCVKKMDHHCPWINTCVGWANHAHFTRFLGFAVAGCAQAAVILCGSFYRGIHRSWYLYHGQYALANVQLTLGSLVLCVFSLGLAIGVVVAVGMLFVFQVRSILRNRTGVEDWILEKARYRRYNLSACAGSPDDERHRFRHPYDLGSWRRNAEQVGGCWSRGPRGDGIRWQLADEYAADQYALTVEQIAQKRDKRRRTRRYRVWRDVSGSWWPLWSQGWRTAMSPPCTDEARLRLRRGDVVNVSRWKQHWLFGERIGVASDGAEIAVVVEVPHKERVRGWFPRRCAVEFYVDSAEDEDQSGGGGDDGEAATAADNHSLEPPAMEAERGATANGGGSKLD